MFGREKQQRRSFSIAIAIFGFLAVTLLIPAAALARGFIGLSLGFPIVPAYPAYPPPAYYYAPPPAYYPAPPVYYAPPAYRSDGYRSEGYGQTDHENCREYQGTATIDGRPQRTYGTACLQPDGTWRIVR